MNKETILKRCISNLLCQSNSMAVMQAEKKQKTVKIEFDQWLTMTWKQKLAPACKTCLPSRPTRLFTSYGRAPLSKLNAVSLVKGDCQAPAGVLTVVRCLNVKLNVFSLISKKIISFHLGR